LDNPMSRLLSTLIDSGLEHHGSRRIHWEEFTLSTVYS